MRRRLTVCLSLAALFGAGVAPAQDPVEFSRLSTDQKQLAEQVRRLEKILITLEEREREEGASLRADLLKQAREKLINGAKERPLASVLEEVASDLADLRAGAALERQAELIRFLEDLLDFLLETERRDQVQDLMQAAREREAELRALASEQAELRERTEALQQREAESGEIDAEARAELAREQAELNERIREAAAADERGAGSERAENAAAEGERAEAELDPDGDATDPETGERAESEPGEPGENSESQAGENTPGETGEQESGEQGENQSGEQSETPPGEQGETPPGEQGEAGENPPSEPGEQQPGEQAEPQAGEPGEQEPGEAGEQQPPEQGERQPGEQQEAGERQPGEQQEAGERQPGEQQEAGERQPGEQQSQQPPSGQQQSPQQPRDPQEQLERAEEFQRKAEEELERGADEAAAEADRLAGVDELETLINVLEKAEELMTRHDRVLRDFGSFVSELDGTARVPRSARVDLRGWASEQRSIADEADSLLFEIREAGADSFPFMLRGLVDDHGLLARRIGPPKYRADIQGIELGARIQRDWERLVNALRTEAERLRKKIEQPEQPQGEDAPQGEGEQPPQEPSPLVSVAAEVQLLKQLQADLLERMQSMQSRRELLSSAGFELDEDDLAELEAVVQRQKRLRTLFESILERLQDTGETGEEI